MEVGIFRIIAACLCLCLTASKGSLVEECACAATTGNDSRNLHCVTAIEKAFLEQMPLL